MLTTYLQPSTTSSQLPSLVNSACANENCSKDAISFAAKVFFAFSALFKSRAVVRDGLTLLQEFHNNELGLTTPGTLQGFPPPGMPENLYFTATILRYIAQGYGRRIDNGDSKTGNIVKTDGTGRR